MGAGLVGAAGWPHGSARALQAGDPPRVIDAHCHIFNAADIAIYGFTRNVLANIDELPVLRLVEPTLCRITNLIRGAAPTVADELQVIDAHRDFGFRKNPVWLRNRAEERRALEVDIVAAGLGNLLEFDFELDACKKDAEAMVGWPLARRQAWFAEQRAEARESRLLQNRARDILDNGGTLGVAAKWLVGLTRYRFEIADELFSIYGVDRGEAGDVLITPALVDFGFWLDDLATTPITDQINLMGRFAGLYNGRVHALAPFDPWREVLHGLKAEEAPDGALAEAERAIVEEGAVGVKIYPPMGFRPTGNAEVTRGITGQGVAACPMLDRDFANPDANYRETWREGVPLDAQRRLKPHLRWYVFHPHMRKRFHDLTRRTPWDRTASDENFRLYGEMGAAIDSALDAFYAWAVDRDVLIMAHTRDSQATASRYGQRANPLYWSRVLKKHPALRLNLSHLGDMLALGAGSPEGPQRSWGWAAACLMQERPNVYGDVGFFEPILKNVATADTLLQNARLPRSAWNVTRFFWELRRMFIRYPAAAGKVLYGSDFVMLAHKEGYKAHFRKWLEAFRLRKDPSVFSETWLTNRFFWGNAEAAYGLGAGARTHARVKTFYARRNLGRARAFQRRMFG